MTSSQYYCLSYSVTFINDENISRWWDRMDPQQIFTWGKIGKLSDTGWKNIEKQRGWTNRNLINLEGEVQKPCTSEKNS